MKETLKRMLARYVHAMRHGDHYDEFHKLLNLLRQSKDEKTTIKKILERMSFTFYDFTFWWKIYSFSVIKGFEGQD